VQGRNTQECGSWRPKKATRLKVSRRSLSVMMRRTPRSIKRGLYHRWPGTRRMGRRLAVMLVLVSALAGCEVFDKQAALEYEAATKRWYAGDYPPPYRCISDCEEHPYSPMLITPVFGV